MKQRFFIFQKLVYLLTDLLTFNSIRRRYVVGSHPSKKGALWDPLRLDFLRTGSTVQGTLDPLVEKDRHGSQMDGFF